jgi:hypothetical protein
MFCGIFLPLTLAGGCMLLAVVAGGRGEHVLSGTMLAAAGVAVWSLYTSWIDSARTTPAPDSGLRRRGAAGPLVVNSTPAPAATLSEGPDDSWISLLNLDRQLKVLQVAPGDPGVPLKPSDEGGSRTQTRLDAGPRPQPPTMAWGGFTVELSVLNQQRQACIAVVESIGHSNITLRTSAAFRPESPVKINCETGMLLGEVAFCLPAEDGYRLGVMFEHWTQFSGRADKASAAEQLKSCVPGSRPRTEAPFLMRTAVSTNSNFR